MVTVSEKKEFIRTLLNTVQLKRRESVWILNYLISSDEILRNVHFVEQAQFCPRGIIISSHCSEDVPFRYYKASVMTTDAEKSFHDIRSSVRDNPVYLEINYKIDSKWKLWRQHVGVLEFNAHAPKSNTSIYESKADNFLRHCLNEGKRNVLMNSIDEAIENGDKKTFMQLTEELKNLPTIPKNFITVKGTTV